jgi:hypothetical protein
VKTFTHGLCLASIILILGMIGVAGCSADNETEADKLAKGAGDPGKANTKGAGEAQAPPATQAEFKARQDENAKKLYSKGSNYPGAKNAKE